ncbi:MAG: recombinase family protein [Crocinitomicaceae bacterium]|nr:recombinase family protein [Crocinitomicaceae bacterium]
MRVIIYKRVSTDEQADKGFSLSYQDEVLREFCKRMKYDIVDEYIEDCSGKDFDRPEYKKMFSQLEKDPNAIDLVLVTKWDRFGRNIEFCLTQIRLLKDLGVQVNAYEQWINVTAVDSGVMMLSMYLSYGQSERENIVSRTTSGSNKARRQGYYLGKAPYGYRRKRTQDNKPTLEVYEDEAKFVRRAFNEVAMGMDSVESIFKNLRKEGLSITKQTFYRMFMNPTYCGRIHVTAYLDFPEEIVEGKHDGIVSVATYLKAQANKVNNRLKGIVPKKEDPQFPLRNFLMCGCCGRNLTGSKSKGRNNWYTYYHCRQSCPTRVPAEKVHKSFEDLLGHISIKQELREALLATIQSTIVQMEGDSHKELRRVKYEIKRTQEQIEKLDQQLMNNRVPVERYNRMAETLENKSNKLQVEHDDLENRKSPKKEQMEKVLWIMSNLSNIYKSADYKGKRKLLQALFPEKIILEKEKCRTTKVNEVLALVASISGTLGQKKSGTIEKNLNLYRSVPTAGLEPARP